MCCALKGRNNSFIPLFKSLKPFRITQHQQLRECLQYSLSFIFYIVSNMYALCYITYNSMTLYLTVCMSTHDINKRPVI